MSEEVVMGRSTLAATNVQQPEAAMSVEVGEGATAQDQMAIRTTGLRKKYGKTDALKGLDLQVPPGAVYALLGRNGAGKSTLIQLLLGLLEPAGGQVRVLGLDPIRDGMKLRQRIGYIPERLPMYEWMTVRATVDLVKGLYPTWNAEEERGLLRKFRIPPEKKIRELSRGNRALLALILAMSHEPELVLLDECTSGMDPVFRREFDRSVIEALHGTGRTVLFASHQIRELERICDWVGILDDGKMMVQMPVDDLKASIKMLRVILQNCPVEDLPSRGVLDRRRAGREWLITVRDYDTLLERQYLLAGAQVAEVIDLDLEEIFIALLSGAATEEWQGEDR
ncbi:MAG: ABC transporter ATP-binding protein [Armatimonadota bacterium]|nr:ABC transporter ATP-binding protein [Armatimonadota bacterium]